MSSDSYDNKSYSEMADLGQIIMSEMVVTEAIINILERKGILTKNEIKTEAAAVRKKIRAINKEFASQGYDN